jgi:HSP20 family molecular chaperone IbpA
MHNSDILILVVGILTYSEQKLINRIKTEMKNQNIEKPLFIIHNLVLYDTIEKVENHIQNVLLKCATFKLEKAEKFGTGTEMENGVHYYEKDSKPIIYHLIMANDVSDAGEYYNPYTFKFIENMFQYLTDLKNFDIIESLKERFITLSKDYFEVPISKGELLDNDSIFKNKKLSLVENKNEIKLKCCLIDELGFSNFKGNGFLPKYNYFKNGDKICLRVEVPGNYSISCGKIKYRGEYTIIPINGEKIKDNIPQKIEENLYTTREFGKFEVNIYLQTEKFSIKNEKVKPVTHNGVAVFNFALQTEEINNESTSFNDL